MAFIGAIIGGGLGLIGASQQAKATAKQNEAAMAGFKQYQPYVDNMLGGAEGAMQGQLDAGYYGGPTYAGPNGLQTGTAGTMGQYGTGMMSNGFGMMDANANYGSNAQDLYANAAASAGNISGYAGNFNDIYNGQYGVAANQGNIAGSIQSAAGNFDSLANRNEGVTDQFQNYANKAQNTDYLANANAYALANSQPLIDAAMRDDRRSLEENTLTGIDMAASGSGNMNSSRAGIAEAVANRGYADRSADVRAQINSDLRQDSLAQANTQFAQGNTALSNVGASIAGTGSQYGNNINALNSASGVFGNQTSTLNSAGAAATGAMSAYGNANSALSTAGDFNSQISGAYNNGLNTMQTGGSMAMNAGGILQGYDQAGYDANRATFEGNRDYASGVYSNYNAGILNRAPQNNQPTAVNNSSAIGGAVGGAMLGYDFSKQYFGGGNPSNMTQVSGPPMSFNTRPVTRPAGGFI
jgi:hypothetical protein